MLVGQSTLTSSGMSYIMAILYSRALRHVRNESSSYSKQMRNQTCIGKALYERENY